MKLNYIRTIKVGIAFFIIMIFWEVYDFAIPILLDRTYGLNASMRGLIMGLDNLLAIFLLPLFGMFSDKISGKRFGRRTPFIVVGTIIAAALCIVMILVENAQLNFLIANGVKDANILVEKGFLDAKFITPDFLNALKDSPNYVEFNLAFHNAQTALAASYTKGNASSLAGFVCVLFVLLIAMSAFRSPAVALMPDVTIKPLRSTANAVINFMGGAGAFLSIGLYTFFAPTYGSFVLLFGLLAIIMLTALMLYLIFVKENKFNRLRYLEQIKFHIVEEESKNVKTKLSRSKLISLILILSTVFFWFMGYNAVKSHLSVYATTTLGMSVGELGIINIANGIGGALALLPVAMFANKLGRKKTVLIGLTIAIISFIPCAFIGYGTRGLLGVFFVIGGFGLIIINVNTLPMVVELSSGGNVGKYTGFYYVATMSAQAITPYFAGLFMDKISENSVFIYACVWIALSFIILLFVKHGDNKPEKREILLSDN